MNASNQTFETYGELFDSLTPDPSDDAVDAEEAEELSRVASIDTNNQPHAGLIHPHLARPSRSTSSDSGQPQEGPTAPSPSILPQRGGAGSGSSHPSTPPSPPGGFVAAEVVIDKNGQPRQAGADSQWGEFVIKIKQRAEKDLFFFAKGIMNRFFLTSSLHLPVCRFIQKCPPFRKLILMPREHAKTAIVSGALPPHILIQPAEGNIYFPGLEGSECRLLLAGETEGMAKKNLRVIQSVFEDNQLFRTLWPHRVWHGRPKSLSKAWSDSAIIIPRENEWPDPSIRAVGVGGAVTGARPNVLLKDDLVSFKAANSDTVMLEAIEWHRVSRALLETYENETGLQSLEFTVGTRWSVYDLYSEIIDNDPSVEVNDVKFHQIVQDGEILWKEKHTLESVEQLRKEYGSMFYLLFMNSAADPTLTDFDLNLIREYEIIEGQVVFKGDDRDVFLANREKWREGRRERTEEEIQAEAAGLYGMPFRPETQEMLFGRGEFMRLRYS